MYAILKVVFEKNDCVDGYWYQNHIGTVHSARQVADAYELKEAKWGSKFAVVDDLNDPVPILRGLITDRKKLA